MGVVNQNQNSLLVTRQMTLFHQGVRMGGGGELVCSDMIKVYEVIRAVAHLDGPFIIILR